MRVRAGRNSAATPSVDAAMARSDDGLRISCSSSTLARYATAERHGQRAVDERALDHDVDVVEPVRSTAKPVAIGITEADQQQHDEPRERADDVEHPPRSATVRRSAIDDSPATYANHLTCWRSTPRERRSRSTTPRDDEHRADQPPSASEGASVLRRSSSSSGVVLDTRTKPAAPVATRPSASTSRPSGNTQQGARSPTGAGSSTSVLDRTRSCRSIAPRSASRPTRRRQYSQPTALRRRARSTADEPNAVTMIGRARSTGWTTGASPARARSSRRLLQPHRDVRGLDGVVDDAAELVAQRLERDLVTEPRAERLDVRAAS